jgi:glycosyltransferase involved in cell wall biosynthesis
VYRISCDLPENREPWNISLAERKNLLITSKKQGKKIAAMLYRAADTSTFRYRCYNVMQATKETEEWQSVYFFMDELKTLSKLLPECELLIITRLEWEHAVDELVYLARKSKIPVLFDTDDLICHVKYIKLVTNTLNVHFGSPRDYEYWFAYFSREQLTASLADGFITSNAFLGERLKELFGRPYQVIPNYLNVEQLAVSETCLKQKRSAENKLPFTIGYFSGTPSHINDFRMVSRELAELLRECPEMELLVVGFMDFPPEMKQFLDQGRVRFHPLVDFLELQRLTAEVDVSIVPLVNNTFTNCKSELKFFEASVVETPTVATPVYTYRNAVRDKETGFLCKPGEWSGAIRSIFENPAMARRMVESAKDYCLSRYYGRRIQDSIEQAYNYFARR